MAKDDKNEVNRQEPAIEAAAGNYPSADLLSKEQIEALLPKLDGIISWAKQVQEYALEQALKGEQYNGFKVVAGRSNRTFTNPDMVVDRLIGEGYDEELLYERKLKTLTQLEALVGKKNFEPLMGELIIKPAGKPALVPESDKRPAFTPDAAAAAEFK
jgi:hypothetical protein